MVKRSEVMISVMPCTRELLRDNIAAAEGRHMNIVVQRALRQYANRSKEYRLHNALNQPISGRGAS